MNAEYFESVEMSDVGRKRKNNEDACLRIPERGIYCVADGMGGQAGGDLASETITTSLQQVFAKAAPEEDATFSRRIALFRKATDQASKWIKNFADEKVIGQMGSTMVALVFDPHNPARAVALHAGDSRLYRYRKGKLEQITTDHSAIAALAAKLGRSPESIPAKYQNELLRAVGLTESVELETTPVNVASGDVFLVCTDGLTKMLSDERIAKILKDSARESLLTQAQTLINAANEAGGKDNVTVVLVKAGDLSGAPNVLDPDEEEGKTFVAPPTLGAAEPLVDTAHAPPIPDTADVYGDTPTTPPTPMSDKDVVVERHTPEPEHAPPPVVIKKLTPTPTPRVEPKKNAETKTEKPEAKTPTTVPPTAPTLSSAAKTETKTETKKGIPATAQTPTATPAKQPERRKGFPVGIAVAAVVAIAGVGIWLAVGSKSKPEKTPPVTPQKNPPTAVVTPPVNTNPESRPVTPAVDPQVAIQAAYRDAMAKAQAAFTTNDFKNPARSRRSRCK